MFESLFRGRRVLVTGHTGFKGSWLSLWLKKLGADVTGFALAPDVSPNHLSLLKMGDQMTSIIGDMRDRELLLRIFREQKPEVVFHLAAQPLVKKSYRDPALTFETNVLGVVNLMEAVRATDSVKVIVNVTSDKCYENVEWTWGYRESDRLGGYDPYSASKACSEIVSSCYRRAFFGPESSPVLLATARAGNVIGGGDWSANRIVPDCVKAIMSNETILIRSPHATRPWQHVLEPLSGYLHLAANLLQDRRKFADAWNFGPGPMEALPVETLVRYLTEKWQGAYKVQNQNKGEHEAGYLQLDCSKAFHHLGWCTALGVYEALDMTIDWFREFYKDGTNTYALSSSQIDRYCKLAANRNLTWIK